MSYRRFKWFVEGRLAGAPAPEVGHDDGLPALVDFLRAQNISTIISVQEAPPEPSPVDFGFESVFMQTANFRPPQDLEGVVAAIAEARGAVLVHCFAGIGRTGTVLAAWQLAEDPALSVDDAVAHVRRVYIPDYAQNRFPEDPSQRVALERFAARRGIVYREERPEDAAAIFSLNEQAFGQPDEARIVDALRAAGGIVASWVAVEDGAIVGHVLFSAVTIESHERLGLAPMAVAPAFQRLGIGSALVWRALDALRRDGHLAVVVLGHPAYYPRFGFQRASTLGLRWEHDCPDEAFMALELAPNGLSGVEGVVRYRPEISARWT